MEGERRWPQNKTGVVHRYQATVNSTQHPSWRDTEKCRVMACQLETYGWLSVVLNGYNDQHCDFTSIGEIWSRAMLHRVKYQTRIFRRDAGLEIDRRCWVELISTTSSRYSIHWKLTYSPTSNAVIPLYSYLWISLDIYMHQNIAIPFNNR